MVSSRSIAAVEKSAAREAVGELRKRLLALAEMWDKRGNKIFNVETTMSTCLRKCACELREVLE